MPGGIPFVTRPVLASAVALVLLSAAVQPALAQGREPPPPPLPTGPITATVDLGRTGEPIDRRLYGYFMENLGNMF
ncbi:MAG: hypothetical protein FIB01_05245, partial [Gemmatimonadetes bacterium]|nr:hypothetical protein [Gemmatimonadota bacterium]